MSKRKPSKKAKRKPIETVLDELRAEIEALRQRDKNGRVSEFQIAATLSNGLPVFQDGSSKCRLCDGVRWPKDLSPLGVCLTCLSGQLNDLVNGRTSAKLSPKALPSKPELEPEDYDDWPADD